MALTSYIKSQCVQSQQDNTCVKRTYIEPNNTKFIADFTIENDPAVRGAADGTLAYYYDTSLTAAHMLRRDYHLEDGSTFAQQIVTAEYLQVKHCGTKCNAETYNIDFDRLFIIPKVDIATGKVNDSCAEYKRTDDTDVITAIWVVPKTFAVCKVIYKSGMAYLSLFANSAKICH